jgi:hypothetical protein
LPLGDPIASSRLFMMWLRFYRSRVLNATWRNDELGVERVGQTKDSLQNFKATAKGSGES